MCSFYIGEMREREVIFAKETETKWAHIMFSLTLHVLYHTIPHELCRCQVKDVHGLQSFVSTHSEESDSSLFILRLQ